MQQGKGVRRPRRKRKVPLIPCNNTEAAIITEKGKGTGNEKKWYFVS